MAGCVGLDIGNDNVKLALREGGRVRMLSYRMPENLVNAGDVVAPETMATFLGAIRKDAKVRVKNVSLVLSDVHAFFRHVTLPPMSTAELALNLPYEFRDFISSDPDEFIYDYAVDAIEADEEGNPARMQLYAAAASKALVDRYATMMRKAGFRLKTVVPAPMAYARLLRAHNEVNPIDLEKDVVLVDIGSSDMIVSLFSGNHYDAGRTIDFGCAQIDNLIAEIAGVDPYTASSFKYSNFEGMLDHPDIVALCERFGVEVAKVVNFYNFNNPDREISQIYFLGGGAQIPQLTNAIRQAVSVPAESIDFLLPAEAKGNPNGPVAALALAGVLESEAM